MQEAQPIPVLRTTVGNNSAENRKTVPNENVTQVFPIMAMDMAIQS